MTRALVFGMSADKFGGIESFLLNMNRHMKDCVFDYVVGGETCIYEDAVKKQGGTVFTLTPYSKNPIKHFHQLRRTIKQNRKTHKTAYFNLFSMVHMIPVWLCRIYGYKIVFHSHNGNTPIEKGLYRTLHNIFRKTWGKKKSITRLTCSPAAAEFMFGSGKGREATMIYNAVETERFLFSPEKRKDIRDALEISEKKVIGFVGRLAIQKNPLFLIEIFEKIAGRDDDCVLLMIGGGEMKDEIATLTEKKNLGSRVIMLPPQNNIEDYYCAMDAFLLPSLFEGLPVVLVETQCSGLPAITSSEAVPGLACVSDGMIEFESLRSDADKWAEHTLKLLEKNPDRAQWNRIVSGSRFDIDAEAKKLEKFLR